MVVMIIIGVIDISCPNLTQLCLILLTAPETVKVVINAPKLFAFALFAAKCLTCSFVKIPKVLCQAIISVFPESLLLSILPVISRVRSLRPHLGSVLVLKKLADKGTQLNFSNLTKLMLIYSSRIAIATELSQNSLPASLFRHVKTIEIQMFVIEHDEYSLNMVKEEGLIQEREADCSKEEGLIQEMSLVTQVCKCSKSSSGCRILFSGQYLKLPGINGLVELADALEGAIDEFKGSKHQALVAT